MRVKNIGKALIFLGLGLILNSQNFILDSVSAQTVYEDSFHRLEVRYSVPELQMESQPFSDFKALLPTLDGYRSGGRVGAPALPVRSDVIVIPFCDSIEVTVADALYDTLHFPLSTLAPLQRPRSKSSLSEYGVDFDSALYSTDAFFGIPLVTVNPMGIARDRRLANLCFSPLRVNPVTGEAILCRSATIILTYHGSDPDNTLRHYNLYHTPAYSVGHTLNRLFTAKDATLTLPLRMIIAVGEGLSGCHSLDDFASWKRSQGMVVDFLYADSIPDFSSSLLEDSLRAIYNNATPENPAPLYVILVGDHEQLAASDNRLAPDNWVFYNQFSPHITDHYFASWTTDNIRDAYLGRLSVTNCSELDAVIEKTLLYERYLFTDDSYLAQAVLVAGIDAGAPGDWAYDYADPSLDYSVFHYINSDHRFTQVTYAKNDTTINPGASGVNVVGNYRVNDLRNLYSQGMGFVNYSAHGSSTSWSSPYFDVYNINSMANSGKPSIMIGNCCLTNHFQTPVCFGEALLRKPSGGAAAYIGATNNTFWDDDFFYTVGYRASVSPYMDLAYDASFTGTYDHLFHEHGEQAAVTVGGMMQAGLMSVNSIYDLDEYGPSMVPYYWEIYELIGDPSLIPWLGRALDPVCLVAYYDQTLTVNTVAGAYVALVDSTSHALLAAAFADSRGQAALSLADTAGHKPMLSITAQHHKPFLKSLRYDNIGVERAEEPRRGIDVYPNPVDGDLEIRGLTEDSRIDLLDFHGRIISTLHSPLSTLHLQGLPQGVYFLRISNATGTTIEKIIKK